MRIIGLTGGIASGKSVVSDILASFGACIIDTDKLAREIVVPGEPAWQEIKAWLGPDILLADGSIDRKQLGQIVFSDSEARARLEIITHPRIQAAALAAIAKARQSGAKLAVLVVPLLFETGWEKMVDETWVVAVDEATQLARLMNRDKLTRDQAEARINTQMSLAEKIRLADRVIDNGKDIAATRDQVEAVCAEEPD